MLAAKELIPSMVVLLFLLTSYTYAGTIIVNSTADTDARDDDITLREAIMLSEGDLNFDLLTPEEQKQVSTPVGSGEADTIEFGISGTIIARSSLPFITDDATVIDASSQWIGEWPDGEPGVILDGDWNGDGLHIIGANNCHVRGLFMTEFISCISIHEGSQFNTIGGVDVGYRNILSGNGTRGVAVYDRGTENNIISGNYIGVDATGTIDLGNSEYGIDIRSGAQSNVIGGTMPEERNIISGNDIFGIVIDDLGTDNNSVIGNYIGTDVTGTAALGNTDDGILIVEDAQFNTIGGTTPEERNIILGMGASVYTSPKHKITPYPGTILVPTSLE